MCRSVGDPVANYGLVQDLIKNLVGYILIDMKPDDTYLITDRYYDKNIKK